jgi:hypothetical protein
MRISLLYIALIFVISLSGCSRDEEPRQAGPASISGQITRHSVAGLTWEVPAHWQIERERPMRVATYSTPAADDDSDKGEVAIFYFGHGDGGSVEANVTRWFGQFDQPDGRPTQEIASRESMEVNNIPVTIVRTTGTYNAAAGPMAPRQDVRPGYKLIGAIAEGPQGDVFYKFTGPITTVQKGEPDFMYLVQSIKLQP